jgi:phosphoribosylformimino-5-aminoimidazole carboxamide ribotide isomerase
MIILPAIDIKDGQCVRLFQGNYDRATTYAAAPAGVVEVALRWQAAGASWLHIIDLDGALRGQPVNLGLIKNIRAATSLHIEVGGGIRQLEHITQLVAAGVERVILGTAALADRKLLVDALRRWGECIVVGLDARDGRVAISGWRETSSIRATDLAVELRTAGVQRFIYTDIARDGALSGPNLQGLREMLYTIGRDASVQGLEGPPEAACRLIASGGVSSLADLHALAVLPIEGAIVGRALYTGAVDLASAIQQIERRPC